MTRYVDREMKGERKGKEGCYRNKVEPDHGGVAVREY